MTTKELSIDAICDLLLPEWTCILFRGDEVVFAGKVGDHPDKVMSARKLGVTKILLGRAAFADLGQFLNRKAG